MPVIRAIAAELPGTAISIDTTSPAVAAAALDAGAHLLNDIWGVADDPAMVRLAAERGVPIVLMHNRAEARYRNLVAEVVADLQRALERALDAGVPWDHLIVDPGLRVRQDARPQPRAAARTWARCACWAARSCSARRASPRWASSWTCRRTSAWRRPPRPRRWGSPPASTSSVSTTCARTPARRGSRMRSCVGGARTGGPEEPEARERPDHPRRDGLPGHARRVRGGAAARRSRSRWTWSCALNLQPAGLSDDLEQTVDYSRVFDTCRQIVESTRFNLIEALAEAIAHEILAGFPADEVTIRVRKPAVQHGRPPPGRGRGDPAPPRHLA